AASPTVLGVERASPSELKTARATAVLRREAGDKSRMRRAFARTTRRVPAIRARQTDPTGRLRAAYNRTTEWIRVRRDPARPLEARASTWLKRVPRCLERLAW